eukprot:3899317-Rhodomonas_salina.1
MGLAVTIPLLSADVTPIRPRPVVTFPLISTGVDSIRPVSISLALELTMDPVLVMANDDAIRSGVVAEQSPPTHP